MNLKLALGGMGIVGVTVFCFNNCAGQGFEVQSGSEFGAGAFASGASSSVCEDQLLAQYQNILQPFFSNASRCLNCHSGNGPGIGAFANPNPRVAMASALNIGVSRLLQQSVSSHQQGFTGSQNTAMANTASAQWQTAYGQYTQCSSAAASAGSIGVVSPSVVLGGLKETDVKSLSFDLSQAAKNPLPLRVNLSAKLLIVGGVVQGYQFYNPQAQLLMSGSSYDVSALKIYINNELQNNITTYSNLYVTVNSVNPIPLIGQSENAIIVRTPQSTDNIAVELVRGSGGETKNPGTTPSPTPTPMPTPTVVTFQQLTANGGVFQQRCFSCHSGGRLAGSLDLSNYQQSVTAARNIKARINNAANPMPTGGLMSIAERNAVSAWVDGGTPR